jgi:hypothetical protein
VDWVLHFVQDDPSKTKSTYRTRLKNKIDIRSKGGERNNYKHLPG